MECPNCDQNWPQVPYTLVSQETSSSSASQLERTPRALLKDTPGVQSIRGNKIPGVIGARSFFVLHARLITTSNMV